MNEPSPDQRLFERRPPRGRVAVMRQRWGGLLFLHWAVDPALVQARLPRGLWVDRFAGEAWLGVVPFFMDRVRPTLLLPVPGLSWFLELNVRTYVHDAEGRPGVWFFSLDCNQPLAVELARRWFHLPYEHAAMRSRVEGSRVRYRCRRRGTGTGEARYDYQMAGNGAKAAAPGSLEWFLVERYRLFSENAEGGLRTGQVSHEPYLIEDARCGEWSALPLEWCGFPAPDTPPRSALVAREVDVSIYPPGEVG